MSVEQNIALARQWFEEVWNKGNLQAVEQMMAPDGIGWGQRGADTMMRGPKEFVNFASAIRAAFPDIQISVEDAFGSGDKVVVRWTAQMTHTGEHLGVAPSGKRVRITGMSIARIVDNKLIEGWDNWDELGMLRAIGAVPAEPAKAENAA